MTASSRGCRRALAASLALGWLLTQGPAHAQRRPLPHQRGALETPVFAAPEPRAAPTPRFVYPLALATSYVAAPLLGYWAYTQDADAAVALPALLPPLVHWGFDRGDRAAVSLVMQPAAIYTGGMLGLAPASMACAQGDCSFETPIILGAIGGYVSWALADVVFFSGSERREQTYLAPGVRVTERDAVGTLGGRF